MTDELSSEYDLSELLKGGVREKYADKSVQQDRFQPLAIGKEDDMASSTVAQMTQSELKEMLEAVVETTVEEKLLEILGDPDEGLELREAVLDRLIRQRQAVAKGRYGQPLEDVVRELGLE